MPKSMRAFGLVKQSSMSRRDARGLCPILVQGREGPRNSCCISTAGFLNYCSCHLGHSFAHHLDFFYITSPTVEVWVPLILTQSPPRAV